MSGVIYIADSEHWGRDVYKIGRSSKADATSRLAAANSTTWNLDNTEIAYEIKVDNEKTMERLVHKALQNFRISDNREFFKVPIQDAIKTIQTVYEEHKHDGSHDIGGEYGRFDYLLLSGEDPFAIYSEFRSLDQDVRLYFLKRAIDEEEPIAVRYAQRLQGIPRGSNDWSIVEAKAISWLKKYFSALITHLERHGEKGSGEAYFKSFFVWRAAEERFENFGRWHCAGNLSRAKRLGYRKAAMWEARIQNNFGQTGNIRNRYFSGLEAAKAGYVEGCHYMAAYLRDTRIDDSRDTQIRQLLLESARDGNPHSWELLEKEYMALDKCSEAAFCRTKSERAEGAWYLRQLEKWYEDFRFRLPDERSVLELRMDE